MSIPAETPALPAPDATRWMQVGAYAKACGLTREISIKARIKRGTLPCVEQPLLDGTTLVFIDALAHPPVKMPNGRKRKGLSPVPSSRPAHSGYQRAN